MSCLSAEHQQLDIRGIGKCSVPMWSGAGCPAGFCDKPAYGTRPPGITSRDSLGRVFRLDGLYDGYVPALACPSHGGPNTRVFKDGNSFCAVRADFINLQESPAGFGNTPEAARAALETQ